MASAPIEAQQLDSIQLAVLSREIGSTVRVSTRLERRRIEGRLSDVTAATLRIVQPTGTRTVAFSSRDTLWTRELLGPTTGAKHGAYIGVGIAAGVVLLGSVACGSSDADCTELAPAALVLGATWGVIGAGAGFILGSFINQWVRKNP